jgi:hypothetical protein
MRKKDYAEHRKVTAARVSHWIRDKRLVLVGDKVDVEASDRLLEATYDNARRPAGADRAADDDVEPAKRGRPSHRDGSGRSYQDARRDRERWKAKSDELAYRREAGELVEWPSVQKALAAALAPIMSRLQGLPQRICRHVAGTDVRRVQIAVEKDVQDACREVANALRALAEDNRGATRQ